jgi:hypothetical protein
MNFKEFSTLNVKTYFGALPGFEGPTEAIA